MNGPCIDHGKTATVGNGYAGVYAYGKQRRLHRVVYALHHGMHPDELPIGGVVMHTCDNPRCINPNHLLLGTQQDNMDDKMAKGRHRCPSGEDCAKAILTAQDVLFIRCAYIPRDRDYGQRALARRFNVGQMTIHDVVHNLTWKDL